VVATFKLTIDIYFNFYLTGFGRWCLGGGLAAARGDGGLMAASHRHGRG